MSERKISQGDFSDVITVCNNNDSPDEIDYGYSVEDEKKNEYYCSANGGERSGSCYSVGDEKTVVPELDSFDDYKNLSSFQKRKENIKESFHYVLEIVSIVYLKYSLSIFLDNNGSTARDHLANERTFLAWIRTSLSLTTSGIAIIQIFDILDDSHQKMGKSLGLLFVITSVLFVFFGNIRYFHIQASLQRGSFPASRSIVTLASFIVLFISISILLIIALEL